MSTLVCGCTWPLAVTDATRSRFCTGSMRTSTALPPRLAAPSPPTSTTTSATAPAIDHFIFLVMDVPVPLSKWTPDRALERGEGLVIVVTRVQPVNLCLLERTAARGDVEERGRADLVPLFGIRQLFACLLCVHFLQRH